jgi:predicted metal-dependent RNase
MLEGGPSVEYFKQLAPDERNTIVFVSYQIEGTIGRRIQKGLPEISLINNDGKMEIIKIKSKIEAIEGFSGHSDRNQIFSYIRRISTRPEKIIMCHGERSKCLALASFVSRMYKLNTYAPETLDAIRLR